MIVTNNTLNTRYVESVAIPPGETRVIGAADDARIVFEDSSEPVTQPVDAAGFIGADEEAPKPAKRGRKNA